MSLLNDMLRDLVRQQQPASNGNNFEQVTRREAMSVSDQIFSRWIKIILVFILVFTLVLLIKHFVTHQPLQWSHSKNQSLENQQRLVPQAPSISPPSISPPSINSPELNVPTDQQQKKSLPTNYMAAPNRIEPALDETTQLKIQELLAHAKNAVTQDRLTSPIEDNAYSDYQKILQLDANNATAKEGIENIAVSYIARAQEQLRLGNNQQAQAYFQRAEYVAPEYFQNMMETAAGNASDQLINLQAHENSNQDLINHAPNNVKTDMNPQTSVTTKLIEKKSDVAVAGQATTEQSPIAEEKSHLAITPNAAWKDEQAARKARELLSKSQIPEAKILLEKNLAADFHSPQSINVLHAIYVQELNFSAADDLTNRADFLADDQRTLLRAQSLTAQSKEAEAIQLLEEHNAAAENNETYRALLAGLYHKTGQYQASVTRYQQLLNRFGDKPGYWLGLALGYDGLVQPRNAEQCYQRLRQFSQLQPQVIAYVDKRLAALHVQ